jgi:hypothetical protein
MPAPFGRRAAPTLMNTCRGGHLLVTTDEKSIDCEVCAEPQSLTWYFASQGAYLKSK